MQRLQHSPRVLQTSALLHMLQHQLFLHEVEFAVQVPLDEEGLELRVVDIVREGAVRVGVG